MRANARTVWLPRARSSGVDMPAISAARALRGSSVSRWIPAAMAACALARVSSGASRSAARMASASSSAIWSNRAASTASRLSKFS
ncbi:Uncharacterised protein [Mycobacteroides abscessus subsp. abscessus]|nr:Uncharacterised protein [Mycobacteroides abscessus subsp. abscessus]